MAALMGKLPTVAEYQAQVKAVTANPGERRERRLPLGRGTRVALGAWEAGRLEALVG